VFRSLTAWIAAASRRMRDGRLNKLKVAIHYRKKAFIDGLDREKQAYIDGLSRPAPAKTAARLNA
jgi:hypothetical protein